MGMKLSQIGFNEVHYGCIIESDDSNEGVVYSC